MSYSPPAPIIPTMVSILTNGIGSFSRVGYGASDPGSAAWESADRAVYLPVVLPAGCVLRRVWWANGATTTGGATVEVGIYADSGYGPGAKLISGSATQGTASAVQFVDVTDTALAAGLHWIAIAASTATNTTFMRSVAGAQIDGTLRMQQASARPLPATATPVESSTTLLYLCGFATTASP